MRRGARLPKKYLDTSMRTPKECKHCVVCNKILREKNKS